jgi:serine/threonine protein kinase
MYSRFSKKSDIFALGCILYELVIRQKLFSSDFKVEEYGRSGKSLFPDKWPESPSESVLSKLGELAASLLEVDPHKRFTARDTLTRLRTIARRGGVALGQITDVDSDEESDISEDESPDFEGPVKVHPANMAPARALAVEIKRADKKKRELALKSEAMKDKQMKAEDIMLQQLLDLVDDRVD